MASSRHDRCNPAPLADAVGADACVVDIFSRVEIVYSGNRITRQLIEIGKFQNCRSTWPEPRRS